MPGSFDWNFGFVLGVQRPSKIESSLGGSRGCRGLHLQPKPFQWSGVIQLALWVHTWRTLVERLITMLIVSPLSRVVGPLPNGQTGLYMGVTNHFSTGMILQVHRFAPPRDGCQPKHLHLQEFSANEWKTRSFPNKQTNTSLMHQHHPESW